MKKYKLKPAVKKILIASFIFVFITVSMISVFNISKQFNDKKRNIKYVTSDIFNEYSQVINQEEKVIKPFVDENVKEYKLFYEKNASEENQIKSIIYNNGIYMQNSGIDYNSENTFDVKNMISGTVLEVKDDTSLGKTVQVKVSDNLIINYQSLSEVGVKKGDILAQGDNIGKSGSCNLYKNEKNILHIEVNKNGTLINPQNIINKSLKEIES